MLVCLAFLFIVDHSLFAYNAYNRYSLCNLAIVFVQHEHHHLSIAIASAVFVRVGIGAAGLVRPEDVIQDKPEEPDDDSFSL